MPEIHNQLITPKYKSYAKLLAICINVSLSAFWFGYSFVYMGTIGANDLEITILKEYNFLAWELENKDIYRSIIQGVLPIGAIFGALISSHLIRRLSRRYIWLYSGWDSCQLIYFYFYQYCSWYIFTTHTPSFLLVFYRVSAPASSVLSSLFISTRSLLLTALIWARSTKF
jgi:hypothetical protein